MKYLLIFFTGYLCACSLASFPWTFMNLISWRQPENGFSELAQKFGFNIMEYDVTTEDGYILKLFRIPGNKTKAVLLMHGFIDSADTFMVRGQSSWVAALSEGGYDVWLGNTRGNKYSRRHERLNPDIDEDFWDFSLHELALIDLRELIDFILRINAVSTLSLIGHSQGNTLFYILGSIKPEYNEKVNVAVALGPVCYLDDENLSSLVPLIADSAPMLSRWLLAMTDGEIFGETSYVRHLVDTVCAQERIGYKLCGKGVLSALAGEDLDEFEPEFFYSLVGHYPTSASSKNALHLLQIATQHEFVQFDHGPEKNLEVYKSKSPPLFDLTKVNMKIAILVGVNDKLTPMKNMIKLKDQLPNVVSFQVMEHKKLNHMDFVWGKHMSKYLFPHVMKLLEKYS